MKAVRCNTAELARPGDLNPLRVDCYGGDILSVRVDVLLISTFQGSYIPEPGTIQHALFENLGISFGTSLPRGTESHGQWLHRFPTKRVPAFSELWMLELTSLRTNDAFSRVDLEDRFRWLGYHLNLLVKDGAQSISIPLMGTGSQGLDAEKVILETLHLVKLWSSTDLPIRLVNIFAFQPETMARLNSTIDKFFGFSTAHEGAHLLRAAQAELLAKVESSSPWPEGLRQSLEALLELSRSIAPSSKSIALQARITAEYVCKLLCERHFDKRPQKEPLGQLYEAVKASIIPKRDNWEWIRNYFELIITLGNRAAHSGEAPTIITLSDAAAILISAMRISEFAVWYLDTTAKRTIQ